MKIEPSRMDVIGKGALCGFFIRSYHNRGLGGQGLAGRQAKDTPKNRLQKAAGKRWHRSFHGGGRTVDEEISALWDKPKVHAAIQRF